MDSKNTYFPTIDGIPFLSGFVAWSLLSWIVSIDFNFSQAAILCLPYGFAFYCWSSIKRPQRKLAENPNQTVIIFLSTLIMMIGLDEISGNIFQIHDRHMQLNFKTFIIGMFLWGVSLSAVFRSQSCALPSAGEEE